MPNESVLSGEGSARGINHLPGLSALRPEPDAVDHPRGRVIVMLFGKTLPTMILGGGQSLMKMAVSRAEQVFFDVIPKIHDGLGARAQLMAPFQPTSGHPTPNTTTPFNSSHANRGAQSSDCGKSRRAWR
jgi:hypothetical protein